MTKLTYMEEQLEKLAALIDRLDSLQYSITMPVDNKIHVESMRSLLPGIVEEMKESYTGISGENPWE